MIRLRPLRPREQRNLRHWAMELVVVVVGVMIALWASEWAEEQRQRAELKRVEADMIEELKSNVFAVEVHATMRPCFINRATEIRDLLIASDGTWPGLESGTVFATNLIPLRFPSVFSYPSLRPTIEYWRYGEETGLTRLMDPERRRKFAVAYGQSENAIRQMNRVVEKRAELSGLVYPGSLTPEMRNEAIGALRELDSGLWVLDTGYSDLIESVRALGIRSGEEWERNAKRFLDQDAQSGEYAPCVRELTNPLATELAE